MSVSPVRPWRTALQRECSLPSSVVGPVLLSALRRLASICLREVMDIQLTKWVRFVSCEYVAIRFGALFFRVTSGKAKCPASDLAARKNRTLRLSPPLSPLALADGRPQGG